MTRKDLLDLIIPKIYDQMNELKDPNDKVALLECYLLSISQKLEEVKGNYDKYDCKCKECFKYSDPKDFKMISESEKKKKKLFSGYRMDDDVWATVEVITEYKVCPKCGHREKIKSYTTKVLEVHMIYK